MTSGVAVVLRTLPVLSLIAYPFAGNDDAVRRTLFVTLAVACLAAAAAGILLYRPLRQGMWTTLLTGLALFVVGDLLASLDAALDGVAPRARGGGPRPPGRLPRARGGSTPPGRPPSPRP